MLRWGSAAALLCSLLVPLAACLPSPRPILGYNTWNCFRTRIDEALIRATADRMVELGLVEAGYTHLNLDDGWTEKKRDGAGRLVGDKKRFPSGMPALGRYIHAKDLQWGIYGDAGEYTCAGYPGSRGHEVVDAQTWADWGVDYLKYDNCYFSPRDWDPVPRYTAMRDALNATGRQIFYSLCEWGWLRPWAWADKVGHSWRTTGDIEATWESVMEILDAQTDMARFSGPDRGWADADMLEVGNGKLTVGEQRAHFALWAVLKSPLLIGADLRKIKPESLAILKAKEVVAINQDPLGVPGDLVWLQGDLRIYAAPLADGSRAAVLLNAGGAAASNFTLLWEQLGLAPGSEAAVRDLYAGQDLGQFRGSYSAAVPSHDVAALRISPLNSAGGNSSSSADDGWRPWHQLHSPLPPPVVRHSTAIIAGATVAVLALIAGTWAACRFFVRRRRQGRGWLPLGANGGLQRPASGVQLGLARRSPGRPAEEV